MGRIMGSNISVPTQAHWPGLRDQFFIWDWCGKIRSLMRMTFMPANTAEAVLLLL